jgi:hypothetical protein
MDFSKKLYKRFNTIKSIKKYDSYNIEKKQDNLNITENDIRIEIDNTIDMKYNETLYNLSYDLQNYCRENAYPLNIDFNNFKDMIINNSSSMELEYENLKIKMNDELNLEYSELVQLENRIENDSN